MKQVASNPGSLFASILALEAGQSVLLGGCNFIEKKDEV